MGRVAIRKFFPDDYPVEDGSLERVHQLSSTPGLDKWIAVLPEVHYKKDYVTPTGIVAVSKDHIFPTFIALVVNCGMRVLRTGLKAKDLSDKDIDTLYRNLMANLSIRMPLKRSLDKSDTQEIFTQGFSWVAQKYGIDPAESRNIENMGNMFTSSGVRFDKELIMRSVPEVSQKLSRYGMSYMGGGGHFVEMQVVDKVLSKELAEKLGIFEGQVVFMMHSDSGAVGGMIGQYFGYNRIESSLVNKFKFNALKLKYHFGSADSKIGYPSVIKEAFLCDQAEKGIPADSLLGKRYVYSSYAAANFGYVKRAVITEILRKAFRETFGDSAGAVELLYDVSHNLIQREELEGEWYWVHRHGCCRCLPKDKMPEHPVYSVTGQPYPLPSSMGTPSYICAASGSSAQSFYSSCHGTGKKRGDYKSTVDEKYLIDYMKDKNIRFYRAGGRARIARYDPQTYKDPEGIIRALETFDIAKGVARVFPMAVLKE